MVKKRITYNTLVYHNQSQFYKDQKTNDKEKQTHTSFYIESSKNVLSTILPCSHTTYPLHHLITVLDRTWWKDLKTSPWLNATFSPCWIFACCGFSLPCQKGSRLTIERKPT